MKFTDINIQNIRKLRQQQTILKVKKYLQDPNKNFPIKITPSIKDECPINNTALQRFINKEDRLSRLHDIKNKCVCDSEYTSVLADHLAIDTTRQCSLDEQLQFNELNNSEALVSKYIKIEKLPNSGKLSKCGSKKDGVLVSHDNIKLTGEERSNYTKSFDAEFKCLCESRAASIMGYIFAKTITGKGGHQDNVFREAVEMIEWVNQFHSNYPECIFVVLIDSDEDNSHKKNELSKKYSNQYCWIVNNVEFQEKIFDLH